LGGKSGAASRAWQRGALLTLGLVLFAQAGVAGYLYSRLVRIGGTIIVGHGFSGDADVGAGVRVGAGWVGPDRYFSLESPMVTLYQAYYTPPANWWDRLSPVQHANDTLPGGSICIHEWACFTIVRVDPRLMTSAPQTAGELPRRLAAVSLLSHPARGSPLPPRLRSFFVRLSTSANVGACRHFAIPVGVPIQLLPQVKRCVDVVPNQKRRSEEGLVQYSWRRTICP
jgi:hypothetical protein